MKTVPSLGCARRSLWRNELNLGAAVCRPGVTHMAYLASSVWLCVKSAVLDLDRPLKRLNQQPVCSITVSSLILAHFLLATMCAKAFVFSIQTRQKLSVFSLNTMTQF